MPLLNSNESEEHTQETQEESLDSVIAARGGIVENRHRVHIAVTDAATGGLLFSSGDPFRTTLIRSAAKPAQALAVLETGAFDLGHDIGDNESNFDDGDLALMCASHSAEERHLARARKMLAKACCREVELRCGGHASINDNVNREWIRQRFSPTPLYNNCSGKHIGMLAGARAIQAPREGYHTMEHPMQRRVQLVVEQLAGDDLDQNAIKWAVDGCNLPAPALPLNALARMYGEFAAAAAPEAKHENFTSTFPGWEPQMRRNLSRIFYAMTEYPDLVAGEHRFCTALMELFKGALIGKVGADGCYGVGVRESRQTQQLGARGAIGIGVKVEDGNLDIVYCAVAEALAQLGIEPETGKGLERLATWHHPQRLNTAGIVVGVIEPRFKLWDRRPRDLIQS